MNARRPRGLDVAAAAVALGGALALAFPGHGSSLLRIVLVTAPTAAGLDLWASLTPRGWAGSPFEWSPRRGPASAPRGETGRVAARLGGRRRRLPAGAPLPPGVIHLLRPLVAGALERRGLDPRNARDLQAARRHLSPTAWGILSHDPDEPVRWLDTRRPDRRRVAGLVHDVLDELQRLEGLRPSPDDLSRFPGTP